MTDTDTLYTYEVAGTGLLPIALLSVEQAWPATLEDAHAIILNLMYQRASKLNTIALASHKAPNVTRWQDLDWTVAKLAVVEAAEPEVHPSNTCVICDQRRRGGQ